MATGLDQVAHTNTGRQVRKTALALAVGQALFAAAAHSATLTVNTTTDVTASDALCTLREAINAINLGVAVNECSIVTPGTNDQIVFDASILASSTITLNNGQINIERDVEITAPTDNGNRLTVQQNTAESRVFFITGMNAPEVTLNNLRITGGNINNFGAGIYVNDGAQATLSNCEVTGNTSLSNGAGISVYGVQTELSLIDSQVTGNTANRGGGLELDAGSISIQNSLVNYNRAIEDGGGMLIYSADVTILSSSVNNNTAGTQGGAVAAHSSAQVRASGSSHFDFNQANSHGGGFYFAFGSSLFLSDYAHSYMSTSKATGGGIALNSANLTMSGNAYLQANAANSFGGGISLVDSQLNLNNAAVQDNFTSNDNGGGIAVRGSSVANIAASSIHGNTAASFGGGIYVLDSTANISNTTVSSNNSASNGGGIMANNGGFFSLNNVSIADNYAGANGGGINVYEGAGGTSASIANTVIAGNVASGVGEDIAAEGTISIAELGTNLFGSSSIDTLTAFFNFNPGNNNLVATSDGNTPTALAAIVTGLDSSLSDLAFLPSPNSPLIDAADSARCPNLDQRGRDRGVSFPVTIPAANGNIAVIDLGGECDIGAIEYESGEVAAKAAKLSAAKTSRQHKYR